MRRPLTLATILLPVALLAHPAARPASAPDVEELLEFAAEMAVAGHWREARFRYEQADRLRRDDPRILNNLAVASEALGEFGRAEELYEKARARAGNDRWVAWNAAAANRSRARLVPEEDGGSRSREADAASVFGAGPGRREKRRDRVVEVTVDLPLPPKLPLAGLSSILVASFVTNEAEFLDVNREIVRFLRGELRKRSALEVLDVSPAPPVPEQTLEDMAANSGFWKHLGREHGADLVVSGVLRYTRRDASGFREVDWVNPRTGQKEKVPRFVEQQEFGFQLDVLFFRGLDGALLYRDRFRRAATYQGSSNDAVTAFYELAGHIAEDVLSAVAPRTRRESRVLYTG
jgi:Flp pilus assembly protein TadD, contains TPR repeats